MKSATLKILILVPGKKTHGGVRAYIQNIQNNFSYTINFIERGNRKPLKENWIIYNFIRLLFDYCTFILRLLLNRYDIIHINTSMRSESILRDAFYVFVSKLFKKKTVLFFHGWRNDFITTIEKKYLTYFKYFYFKSDCFIVLANDFKKKLESWGYTKSIFLETTSFNASFVKSFTIDSICRKFDQNNNHINILFLARIEKAKGIYEALDAISILNKKFSTLLFTIAGDGSELTNVKDYIKRKNIVNTQIVSNITNESIPLIYSNADLYFLPSYSEGMPITVLDAMAFGLPVVTRCVGGLKDIFVNGKMGYITNSFDPNVFSQLIESLILNVELRKSIALFNHNYAQNNFSPKVVAKRIENIYNKIYQQII